MNKPQFVALVKEKGNYETKVEAERALSAVSNALTAVLSDQDSVNIADIGKFSTKLQKGRTGKLPGSEKVYTTQDKMVPTFSASSVLKAAVAE